MGRPVREGEGPEGGRKRFQHSSKTLKTQYGVTIDFHVLFRLR